MPNHDETIASLVNRRNQAKYLFTAGPASLLPENLTGLRPCFGRGDADYEATENAVLDALKAMSGHREIVRMQGSASLALEIACLNFLSGNILVVSTGYYSARLLALAEAARRQTGQIKGIATVDWKKLPKIENGFDWIVACYTETSVGLRLPVDQLAAAAKRSGARLLLDATASIGLEPGHELADVIAYSSCKGLFGLTGAAFLAYNEAPRQRPDSFYLNLENHAERRMTGPYHAIASLADVLPKHPAFRAAVVNNKAAFMASMRDHLTRPDDQQPLLCTQVNCAITSTDPRAILYSPRGNATGSVVCHLGEVHLGEAARGDILNVLTADQSC
jgi:aspartate aminotransferase-like enzyme